MLKSFTDILKRLNFSAGLLAILASLFLCAGSVMAYSSYSLFYDIGSGQGIPFLSAPDLRPGTDSAGQLPGFTGGAPGLAPPKAWDGSTRVTMLVMGLDYRDWVGGEGPSRSDTMILLTIDPVTRTAGMLSVPRDLWAVIPGFTPNKINVAYYFGELYNVPGGGPALAMKTVEATIGVPIDYYAQIDFSAFERFIDLIGGIKVTVPEDIEVVPIGKFPRTIPAGTHTLPGYLALAYARARYTEGGDFARAERQQQVILGIRDRLIDPAALAEMIANAPEIYAELSSGINTNLSLEDAAALAALAVQIDFDDIKRGVINEQYVTFGRSPDDLSILLPIPDRIRALRDEIFTDSSALAPLTPGDPRQRMELEGARIAVLNGSSSGDLAQRTADYLSGLGANVVFVGNAEQAYASTTIIDYTGNPFALTFLIDLLGINRFRIEHHFDPDYPYDVELKLGNDWLNSNSLP
jgi:LCP family protein required for cell wall assembly